MGGFAMSRSILGLDLAIGIILFVRNYGNVCKILRRCKLNVNELILRVVFAAGAARGEVARHGVIAVAVRFQVGFRLDDSRFKAAVGFMNERRNLGAGMI